MIAFAGMIVKYAEAVGMKVPEDVEKRFDKRSFPHFYLFCTISLDRPGMAGEDFAKNARIIAALSKVDCRSLTIDQLRERGCVIK